MKRFIQVYNHIIGQGISVGSGVKPGIRPIRIMKDMDTMRLKISGQESFTLQHELYKDLRIRFYGQPQLPGGFSKGEFTVVLYPRGLRYEIPFSRFCRCIGERVDGDFKLAESLIREMDMMVKCRESGNQWYDPTGVLIFVQRGDGTKMLGAKDYWHKFWELHPIQAVK